MGEIATSWCRCRYTAWSNKIDDNFDMNQLNNFVTSKWFSVMYRCLLNSSRLWLILGPFGWLAHFRLSSTFNLLPVRFSNFRTISDSDKWFYPRSVRGRVLSTFDDSTRHGAAYIRSHADRRWAERRSARTAVSTLCSSQSRPASLPTFAAVVSRQAI